MTSSLFCLYGTGLLHHHCSLLQQEIDWSGSLLCYPISSHRFHQKEEEEGFT